ncbi:MAG: hypothetical protein ACK47B_15315 [Armatimonadota bacterium]
MSTASAALVSSRASILSQFRQEVRQTWTRREIKRLAAGSVLVVLAQLAATWLLHPQLLSAVLRPYQTNPVELTLASGFGLVSFPLGNVFRQGTDPIVGFLFFALGLPGTLFRFLVPAYMARAIASLIERKGGATPEMRERTPAKALWLTTLAVLLPFFVLHLAATAGYHLLWLFDLYVLPGSRPRVNTHWGYFWIVSVAPILGGAVLACLAAQARTLRAAIGICYAAVLFALPAASAITLATLNLAGGHPAFLARYPAHQIASIGVQVVALLILHPVATRLLARRWGLTRETAR